jgi:hypothetical protein
MTPTNLVGQRDWDDVSVRNAIEHKLYGIRENRGRCRAPVSKPIGRRG